MRRNSIIWFFSIVSLIVLVGAFWYSKETGYLAKKNEMKQKIENQYNAEVHIQEITHLNEGMSDAGGEWTIAYQVTSNQQCTRSRAWFSPQDLSLKHIEPEGQCNNVSINIGEKQSRVPFPHQKV